MDHHIIEKIEIRGDELKDKIELKSYSHIKPTGNEQKDGHIDYRSESVVIKPEEDITRIISIEFEQKDLEVERDNEILKINEIRIKKREI